MKSAPAGATALTVDQASSSRSGQASDVYFETLTRLLAAISKGDFEDAGRFVRESIDRIPQ
ncbi:MAG TPA: hypothetical protein VG758_19810 [Hyphomicrobiaceae bacterium]|jgi:hypothetical protein|nr:hypothetical protein [Hyphomicrobiaceae bacterium]